MQPLNLLRARCRTARVVQLSNANRQRLSDNFPVQNFCFRKSIAALSRRQFVASILYHNTKYKIFKLGLMQRPEQDWTGTRYHCGCECCKSRLPIIIWPLLETRPTAGPRVETANELVHMKRTTNLFASVFCYYVMIILRYDVYRLCSTSSELENKR